MFTTVYEKGTLRKFKKELETFSEISKKLTDMIIGNKESVMNNIFNHKDDSTVQLPIAFKHIINVNEVKIFLAFATSALREANNSKEVIQEVKKKTKLKIEIIDGRKEAKIISLNNIFEFINKITDALSFSFLRPAKAILVPLI